MQKPSLPALALLLLAVPFHAQGDGFAAPPAGKMWPLEDLPMDYLRETYGFEPDAAWLERVRLSCLRYGGGSASFVSPEGIILTNHHVVRGQLESMEHDGKNLNTHGYVAKTRADELRIPGASARQVVTTRDVTAEVFDGVDLDLPYEERQPQIDANRRAVLAKARREFSGLQPELVTMFRGARVHLYVYRIFDDIRLVFSPHLALGYFGGHADNFTYPRYALDFALLRAYEDDQPVDTQAFHLDWRPDPVVDGELVISCGNPGTTERHLTAAEVAYRGEALHRVQATGMADFLNGLIAYRKANPEATERMRELEFSLANASKSFDGIDEGLRDPSRHADERRIEKELLRRIADHPDPHPRWEMAFEEIEVTAEELERVTLRWWYQSAQYAPGRTFGPLQRALAIVEDVHPEFGGTSLVNAPTGTVAFPFEPDVFARHIERGRKVLGADDEGVQALLRGREPAEAVAHLMANTRIGDAAYERELRDAGWETVSVSDDPAIQTALDLYPLFALNTEEKGFLEAAIREHSLFIGQAIDAVTGPLVCPDATFTLRLSTGVVKGYEQLSTLMPGSTTFYGLFGRAKSFGNQGDFALPEIWLEREDRIDLATPFNLVCTVDIIGGNSGSPLIDRDGRVVGTLFDGNVQMLENQYSYRDEMSRALAVHAAAMGEAMTKVYDAGHIVEELLAE